MENQIFELQYAIDTFYFLVMGALVMWMAAGFAMLEAGLVRSKNTTEILTKNIALFAVSCTMYLVFGYAIMYGGGWFLSGIEAFSLDEVLTASAENGFDGDSVYSGASDFFFQVVFVATAMSIVSGAVAERMKLWAFLLFAVVLTGFIYDAAGSYIPALLLFVALTAVAGLCGVMARRALGRSGGLVGVDMVTLNRLAELIEELERLKG